MKKLLILFTLFAAFNANAGFLLGYAVGSSMNSVNPTSSKTDQPSIITSDGDSSVIACVQWDNTNTCELPVAMRIKEDWIPHQVYKNDGRWAKSIKPQEYVERSGYKKSLKQGIVIHSSKVYIVLEVQK